MMEAVMIQTAAAVLLIAAAAVRIALSARYEEQEETSVTGICHTNGRKEIQADIAMAFTNEAGTMAVLADGIGNENTGRLCAQLAADTVLDRYEPYHVLNHPAYFFKSKQKNPDDHWGTQRRCKPCGSIYR